MRAWSTYQLSSPRSDIELGFLERKFEERSGILVYDLNVSV